MAHTTTPPPSAALAGWETSVDAALSQLEHAHRAVGGTHSGRRTNTLQLNYAFVLLLSAHFQAFYRDLHSEAEVWNLAARLDSRASGWKPLS